MWRCPLGLGVLVVSTIVSMAAIWGRFAGWVSFWGLVAAELAGFAFYVAGALLLLAGLRHVKPPPRS
jgi:hypothetical protein